MGKTLVVAEKPGVAQSIGAVLGAKKRGDGFMEGDDWADLYGDYDMETKKMILSRVMSSIKVSRDYEVEIDLTVDCEELGISFE